jgi:fructan beta-fructosidase
LFGHGPPAQGSRDGGWECPSLNPITVENSEGETKWLLVVNSNNFSDRQVAIQYFVGEWNGTTFINDNPPEEVNWLDYGPDNYAYVPFANDPKGRRVFMGWMSNWMYTSVTPTSPWRNAVTIPRVMKLRRMDNGKIRPVQWPVEELHSLRIPKQVATIKTMTLTKSNNLHNVTEDMGFVNHGLFDIEVEFDMSKVKGNGTFGLRIGNHLGNHIDVGYDIGLKSFIFDRRNSGVNDVKYPDEPQGRYNSRVWKGERLVDILDRQTVSMRTILDVTSMELFGDGGLTTMSGIFFPTDGIYYTQIYLYADLQNEDSELGVNGGVVYGLKSIWP